MAIDNQYNILPPLSDDEYEDLKDAIDKHRVFVPIYRDEARQTLDGKHREKIYKELGITDYPVVTVKGLTADEKLELSLKLNLVRRHLKRGKLQPIAVQLRQQGWSLERIAGALGVGTSTVHRWLDDVFQSENVTTPAVITDTRGRAQPTRKARPPKEDVSQVEHVTTSAVITDTTGRQPPAHQGRRLKAATAATTDATETARQVPKVSQPPDALPVSTDSAARFDEQASEASIEPSQAPAEPPVFQAADDHGKRVRVQIERLYWRLQQQRAQGTLRALADAWPTNRRNITAAGEPTSLAPCRHCVTPCRPLRSRARTATAWRPWHRRTMMARTFRK